jgi:hypothetical protein
VQEDRSRFSFFGVEFSLEKKKYFPLLMKVWAALAVLLLVSVVFFGYEMTVSDIPGGLVSGVLLAYLIHLFQI